MHPRASHSLISYSLKAHFNVCPSVIELKIQSHNLFLQLFTTFHNLPQSFLKQCYIYMYCCSAICNSAAELLFLYGACFLCVAMSYINISDETQSSTSAAFPLGEYRFLPYLVLVSALRTHTFIYTDRKT